MTGFDSKRQMAQNKMNDAADTLSIVYQRGFADGKRAAQPEQQAEPVAWMTQVGNFQDAREHTTADAALYGWTPVYTTPSAAQRPWQGLTEEQDAKRYSWLRDRLQVRYMQAVTGEKRRGLIMRLGHGFLDSKTAPESGWTDLRYFDECRGEVDAAIDAAIEANLKEQP